MNADMDVLDHIEARLDQVARDLDQLAAEVAAIESTDRALAAAVNR